MVISNAYSIDPFIFSDILNLQVLCNAFFHILRAGSKSRQEKLSGLHNFVYYDGALGMDILQTWRSVGRMAGRLLYCYFSLLMELRSG